MSGIQETEKQLAGLTRAEKEQLLQWLLRDLGAAVPGIESTTGVMGGVACIRETRIPVWLLEQARQLGVSEAELLRNYPALSAQDLANAWEYARSHPDEIEAQIEANERNDD